MTLSTTSDFVVSSLPAILVATFVTFLGFSLGELPMILVGVGILVLIGSLCVLCWRRQRRGVCAFHGLKHDCY